jgi:hypothetical protein
MPPLETAAYVAFAFIAAVVIIMIVAIWKYSKVEDAAKLLTPLSTLLSVILTFYFTKNVADKRIDEEKKEKIAALADKKTAESKLDQVVATLPAKNRQEAFSILWGPGATLRESTPAPAPAPPEAPVSPHAPEK